MPRDIIRAPLLLQEPPAPAPPERPLVSSYIPVERNRSLLSYLEDVMNWHGFIRFLGLPTLSETSKDVPLLNIFVEPSLSTERLSPDAFKPSANLSVKSLPDTLRDHQRIVILGDPGSGKSTIVNWVCHSLASPEPGVLRQIFGPRIPLPLVLRELGITTNVDWDGLVDGFLSRPVARSLNKKILNDLLQSGQAFILLDGIDELSLPIREAVRRAVWQGMNQWRRCAWVLTSRVVGYDEVPFHERRDTPRLPTKPRRKAGKRSNFHKDLPQPDLIQPVGSVLYVAPFSDTQVASFSQRWYRQHSGTPERAELETTEFLKTIRANDNIQDLARIPNLLTLIALVYKVYIHLPDGRSDLYSRISQAYLENIDRHYHLTIPLPYSWQDMERWLSCVAWKIQLRRHNAAIADRQSQPSDILLTKDEALAILEEAIKPEAGKEAGQVAHAFLDFAARRSGLFLPRGEGVYAFMHLSFQEYYAGLYLRDRTNSDRWVAENLLAQKDKTETGLANLQKYVRQRVWQEIFVFLFEMLGANAPERPAQRLRALLGKRVFSKQWPELIAGHKETRDPAAFPRLELVARLSVNRHMLLNMIDREALWLRLWNAHLQFKFWEYSPVPRLLFEREAFRTKVSDSLAYAIRKTGVTELSLTGATSLTDLSPVANLTQLTELWLDGCTGLTDVSLLVRLSKLNTLALLNCPRVSDFAALTSLSNLEAFYLLGSSGFTDLSILGCLSKLGTLVLSSTASVINLSPLANLSNIRNLSLSGCTGLTDLSPLASMVTLDMLTLSGCIGLTDLSPLTNLPILRRLGISDSTGLTNFSPLASAVKLEDLTLSGCSQLNDLSPVANLSNLQSLNLANCVRLTSLSPLGPALKLRHLHLAGCSGLTDLPPLTNLSNLQSLDLSGCTGLTDFSSLAAGLRLQSLDLSGCTGLTDFSFLAGLSKLRHLAIERCPNVKDYSPARKLSRHGCTVIGLPN